MIEIEIATKPHDFIIIEKLAKEILHEVYDPIIPPEHTKYFLSKFQSINAITSQIEHENFSYYFLKYNQKNVGYLGIQQTSNKLILSKLYIQKLFRGLKIGKAALNFVCQFARENDLHKIELIVNQENKTTIEIYLKNGFNIIESLVNSFPNGHSIKDFKMEKKI